MIFLIEVPNGKRKQLHVLSPNIVDIHWCWLSSELSETDESCGMQVLAFSWLQRMGNSTLSTSKLTEELGYTLLESYGDLFF